MQLKFTCTATFWTSGPGERERGRRRLVTARLDGTWHYTLHNSCPLVWDVHV